MGAKTKITQAPTMTPEQTALLNNYMRGVSGVMGSGIKIGEGWGGPSDNSYVPGSGPGGTPFNMSRPPTNPLAAILGMGMPGKGAPIASPGGMPGPMAPVPSAGGMPAANPMAPPDPFGLAGYSNRENLVSPIVNPFRRNLGV